MEQLKVGVGADVQGLKNGLKDAEKQINKFSGKAGQKMEGFQKSTISANAATTAFSRGIQDLPFGIMGVSNNITNLTEQFGYLKQKTGSATGALKAMLADLKGFGGITLLISLATSAWLMYSQSQQGAKKSTNELIDAQKELIGTAKKELSSVNSLMKIAKDENRNKRERQLAISKLQELYPKYLGNIKLESINTEAASKSVDMLTKSLIQQAKVKGAQSMLSELYAKQFEIENKKISEQIGWWETLWTGVKNFGNISKASMEAAEKATANQTKELKVLDTQISEIKNSITELLSEDFDINKVFGGKTKDAASTFKTETVIPLINEFDIFGNKIKESINNTNAQLEGQGIDWQKAYNAQQQLNEQAKIQANLEAFRQAASSIVTNGIRSTFSGIGDAIGGALANGNDVMKAVGGVLLSSIGEISVQLGQQAIAIGIAMLAIKNAFSNPFTAIAAGVALVAMGSYIKNTVSKTTQGVGGGSSSGSSASSTGSGYSAPRTTSSNSGGSAGGTYVFEIAGTKLIGVIDNTLRRNRNFGGNLSISS